MHIHILGIAGKMTAPLAVKLKNHGYKITGSDQEKIYPPVNTTLKNAKIKINDTSINSGIDLAIIGSSYKSFAKTKQEFAQIKKLKIPYISATKYIARNIGKKNSILVAGAWGKSTISSLLVWIFKNAELNPSYMFGAKAINKMRSLAITDSNWSILEADESINGLDRQAKFLYYPAKYVIITSVAWEHKDSYTNPQSNLNAFKKLIQKIPSDGILVYNPQDKNLVKLVKYCRGQSFPYDNIKYTNSLLGLHNQQNISAAATLCCKLKIKPLTLKHSIKTYLGLKQRLEIIKKTPNDTIFVDDFAQSSQRIKAALRAVKNNFPDHAIKVFFEPHASFLQNKKSLKGLKKAFRPSGEVILSKIRYNPQIDKKNRVAAKDFTIKIGTKLKYLPIYEDIEQHYKHTLKTKEILVHLNAGSQQGLKTFTKIISFMDKKGKIN